uniref:DUF1619 domain-containing protein n=1 Tax=Macrostomum lignano TaxID=282301 RepID=A0A1I8F7J6_9PLAT
CWRYDYNWLDNSTGAEREQENAIIGLTGDSLKLDLTLPATPNTCPTRSTSRYKPYLLDDFFNSEACVVRLASVPEFGPIWLSRNSRPLPCHSSDSCRSVPLCLSTALSFELNKQYDETRLQLVRGHAMFSHKRLARSTARRSNTPGLIEVTIGDASCRLTLPQLAGLIQGVQAFVFSALDSENELQPPSKSGTCLSVQLDPIRLSNCNLHSEKHEEGYSALLPTVSITQFVLLAKPPRLTSTVWRMAPGLRIGPIVVNAGLALGQPDLHAIQDAFLRLHDRRFTRLWFLWPTKELPATGPAQVQSAHCGCLGGCAFFGDNLGGQGFYPDNLGATKNRFRAPYADSNSPSAQPKRPAPVPTAAPFSPQLQTCRFSCGNPDTCRRRLAGSSRPSSSCCPSSPSARRQVNSETAIWTLCDDPRSIGSRSNDSLSRRASSALGWLVITIADLLCPICTGATWPITRPPSTRVRIASSQSVCPGRPACLAGCRRSRRRLISRPDGPGWESSGSGGGGGGGRQQLTDRGIASGGGEDASGRGRKSVSSFYTAASNLSVNRLENSGAAVDNFCQQQQHSMSADVDGEDDTTLMPTTLIGAGIRRFSHRHRA